jgi:ribonuclease J
VLAVVGDSTNAPCEGATPSEAVVVETLRELLRGRRGRVAVTCFASHVPRVVTLIRLAEELGRHPVLVGGSMHVVLEAARRAGYLDALPPVVDARDAGYLPRERVLAIVGGSQGEPWGPLSRVARDAHPTVKLDPGDLVVFSAKRIPGNELLVDRVQQELRELGCTIVDADDAPVHVSGHASRDDLRELYGWLRPRYVVPVHGDDGHLQAHAALARELGLEPIEVRDGQLRGGAGRPRAAPGSGHARLMAMGEPGNRTTTASGTAVPLDATPSCSWSSTR